MCRYDGLQVARSGSRPGDRHRGTIELTPIQGDEDRLRFVMQDSGRTNAWGQSDNCRFEGTLYKTVVEPEGCTINCEGGYSQKCYEFLRQSQQYQGECAMRPKRDEGGDGEGEIEA